MSNFTNADRPPLSPTPSVAATTAAPIQIPTPPVTPLTPAGVPYPLQAGQVPHASATEPVPVVPTSPARVLTTDDQFILTDTNGDGLFDTIVIKHVDRVVAAKVQADTAKYLAYHAAIANARHDAESRNAGRSAIDIAAAVNVAERKVKANFKGHVPPATPVDLATAAKANTDAVTKAAQVVEVARLEKL